MTFRRKFIWTMFCILALPPLFTAIGLHGADTADEQVIRGIMARQVKEWNEGTLEGFMAGYWQSPEMTFQSGNRRLIGWRALLDMYQTNYSGANRGTLQFTDIEIKFLAPGYALVLGRWNVTAVKKNAGGDDEPVVKAGLFTLIFQRFEQGWKIIHDHSS